MAIVVVDTASQAQYVTLIAIGRLVLGRSAQQPIAGRLANLTRVIGSICPASPVMMKANATILVEWLQQNASLTAAGLFDAGFSRQIYILFLQSNDLLIDHDFHYIMAVYGYGIFISVHIFDYCCIIILQNILSDCIRLSDYGCITKKENLDSITIMIFFITL